MRALALLGLAVLAGIVVWSLVVRSSDDEEREVLDRQAFVTTVVDGDTLRARIDGSVERVRLIGIDAPERGQCYSIRSTALLRTMAEGYIVRVLGDATQRPRDRFGRVLAYVILSDGIDAGPALLERGAAVVFETSPPFERRDEYVDAEEEAEQSGAGLHSACRA